MDLEGKRFFTLYIDDDGTVKSLQSDRDMTQFVKDFFKDVPDKVVYKEEE